MWNFLIQANSLTLTFNIYILISFHDVHLQIAIILLNIIYYKVTWKIDECK